MTRLRGLLFDKDGTLIDYAATWDPINKAAALAVAGGNETLAKLLLIAGGYDRELISAQPKSPLADGTSAELAEVWAGVVPGATAARLLPVIEAHFTDRSQIHPLPLTDLVALFDRLKAAGFLLGVATNDSLAGAHASLEPLGVIDHLDFLVGYDSGHGGKPGVGMAHAFLEATGLKAEEAAVIGDSPHDLEMGRRAGFSHCIAVLTGTAPRALLAPYADAVLASIEALEPYLASTVSRAGGRP